MCSSHNLGDTVEVTPFSKTFLQLTNNSPRPKFISILPVNQQFTPCKLVIYRYDLQV